MLAYGDLIRPITQQVTNNWQVEKPFTLLYSIPEISFEVILKAVFGLQSGSRYEVLKKVLLKILNPEQPFLRAMMLVFP